MASWPQTGHRSSLPTASTSPLLVPDEEFSPPRRSSLISSGSNMSTSSKNSNKSKQSLSSRASQFFRFRSSSRSRSSVTELSVARGDQCETISIVTVRSAEALESDVIAELPIGTALEIVEVGELARRAKMTAGSIEGWISVKTRLNEPLVTKRAHDLTAAMADFEVGGHHEVQSLVTLRAGESLDSEVIAELKPGTLVRIKELGTINKRRGKVETNDCEGWISMTTRQGELLIGKVTNNAPSNGGQRLSQAAVGSGMFGTSGSKIKGMLEAARCGDLESIKKVVEGSSSFMGKLSGRPNLNCSDIRGKTALIYAAAFGSYAIVQYLLTKRNEVDVNSLDDTQKSALHHASKRARKRPGDMCDEAQADIVKMLLDGGSLIEGRDHNGCTALMFAVANGDQPVASVLLKAGANVNVKDYEGHTPLDYSRNFGYFELAKVLTNAGAVSEMEDQEEDELEGASTLPYASEPESYDAAASACARRMADEDIEDDCNAIADGEPVSPKAGAKRKLVRRGSAKSKASSVSKASTASGAPSDPEMPTDTASVEKKRGSVKRGSVASSKATGKAAPSPKAKGKAKGKVKGKASPKKGGMGGMAAMVAELEGSRLSIAAGVEVLDVKEEADEKEIATDKLKAIMASSTMVGEIEGALTIARAVGVDTGLLEEAEGLVTKLKQKAIAQDRLSCAINDPSVDSLVAAISEAQRNGVPASEIARAQQALEIETPKQKARDVLKAAQDSGDTNQLKKAIAGAKQAKLSSDELDPFEELLKGAESKELATAALKAAIESRDIAQLKFSIQQGKEAGADPTQVSEAEAILKVEEPKAKARESIAIAVEKAPVDLKALEAAIAEGKRASLEPYEYAECEAIIVKEAQKAKAMEEVIKIMEMVKEIDMTSIPVISAAKKQLSNAINEAKSIGVEEVKLNEFELRRRKLHNAIEDLKGSIRVFCRVRPLSKKEIEQGDNSVTRRIDEMTLGIKDKRDQEHDFGFDAVFLPGTQEEVFEDCRDLVQSAADGYNVTLFAYGQTGAGKTYTMGGTSDNPGISRRTIEEIYKVTAAGSSRYNYTVMGSMLELYRQDLFDLISISKEGRGSSQVKKLQVRTDKAGGVVVEGLAEQECKNPDELSKLMQDGEEGRKTTSTAMNAESSRSHLLFIVKVISVNRETHERSNGKISIVDLAGSERLSKSMATGDVAKEAIEINKSLTSLGDVIEALTKNQKQIPYRNHKLTMVMQDSIGGSAKTLMFVNISPAHSNSEETVMSLKYATRAKKITNTQKRNSIKASGATE